VDYELRGRELVMRPCDESDENQIFKMTDEKLVNVGSGFCSYVGFDDDHTHNAMVGQCDADNLNNVTYSSETSQIIIGEYCVDMDHGDPTKPLNFYACHGPDDEVSERAFKQMSEARVFRKFALLVASLLVASLLVALRSTNGIATFYSLSIVFALHCEHLGAGSDQPTVHVHH